MSPRTKDQFKNIRTESRKNILDAATLLFAEKGFNATSIKDITEEAGISKGLIYNYFDSKHDLLDAIIFEAFDEMDNMMKALKASKNNPIDTLVELLKDIFQSLSKNPEFWKLITGLSFKKNIQVRYKEQIEERKTAYFIFGDKIFKQLGVAEPLQEMLFIGAILDGMAFHYLEDPEAYPVALMIQVFKEKMEILYIK